MIVTALLIGGPGNGKVLHIKGGIDIRYPHEDKVFEYQRREFVREKSAWYVWMHGDPPSDDEIYRMIKVAKLLPFVAC